MKSKRKEWKRKMAKQLPKRSEVAIEDTWDLSSLFQSDKDWQTEFEQLEQDIDRLKEYRGHLQDSASVLLGVLEYSSKLDQRFENLLVYAQQKFDTDTADSKHQMMYGKVQNLDVKLTSAASYLEPEILTIPQEVLARYMESEKGLCEYTQFLNNIIRKREHTLSTELEEVLSKTKEFSDGASEIFAMFQNADMKLSLIHI